MDNQTTARTQNSIKNVLSVVIPYFIIGVLGFVKSKVFVTSFNDDIYSLNQLFFQIIGYFSLAEAGFETFIMQKYYKAFSKGDKDEVNNIYSTSVLHFRGLGLIIFAAGFIVMFFVHFLTKAEVDGTYLKLIFILFVVKNIIDYFMMCPRIVLNSDQKAFKTNLLVNATRILENTADIVLALLGVDYLIILLPGIAIRIIFNLLINRKVYREYPWLKRAHHKYKPQYLKGMSNLIYQRIAGILNSNTDIILISTFVDPVSVIIYTSYNYITKFVGDTLYVIATSVTPSFANAVNEGDSEKSFGIFNEMNMSFFFVASFFSVVLADVLDPFVALWMGEKYLITRLGLFLMLFIMFDSIGKRMVTIVVNALGLFRETKIPVIMETVINFITSIVLVQFIGLPGVLIGTVAASLLTSGWYNSYYIYKSIFKKSVLYYIRDYTFGFVLSVILILLEKQLPMFEMNTWTMWVAGSVIYSVIAFAVLFTAFFFIMKPFRRMVHRIVSAAVIKFKGH